MSDLKSLYEGVSLPTIIKRDGRHQPVNFEKIQRRILTLANGLDTGRMNILKVIRTVIDGVAEGVKTSDLDILAAKTCDYMATDHPDFAILAARIEASNLQKGTPDKFSKAVQKLYTNVDPRTNKPAPMVTKEFYDDVMANMDQLDAMINHERDYDMTYFGLKTLQKAYLLKTDDSKVVERVQYMWMRVAVALHGRDLHAIEETYTALSLRQYTHASPTLFNAGTLRSGYASCFLCCPEDDSITGMYKLLGELAEISRLSGGIGIELHKIRPKGSRIRTVNGVANGIIPFMQALNAMSKHVTQGGKRPGSIAVYLSPHHPDIEDFLRCKLPTGSEETKCRDLFTAMWIPDLFMERVKADATWSLFDPSVTPGLDDVYGDEYRSLYEKYETEGRFVRQVSARSIWSMMIQSQIEAGMPYVLYSDQVNRKNNMKHDGIIRSSNLCAEIVQPSNASQSGVCILSSIGLPAYVREGGVYDHETLRNVVRLVVRNLDKLIDKSDMPDGKTRKYIQDNRSIGIGVSGLADTFLEMRMAYDSPEALQLNREIFETIYYAALEESCELAQKLGPHTTFKGSEFSKGRLQFDMWPESQVTLSGRWDFESLREKIKQHGVRNALLTCCMPTASTSQILGYSECIEPYHSNFYKRVTLSGEFVIVNKYLLRDMWERGLWNSKVKTELLRNGGTIQPLKEVPEELKRLYKTAYEHRMKTFIDLSAERAPFLDQTQSLNLFMGNPEFKRLNSALFYAHERGLKTACYYLKQQTHASAVKPIDTSTPTVVETPEVTAEISGPVCTMEEGCLSCTA